MAEYDFNMIKPVDGLQNITGLAPARRREERRRRNKLRNRDDEKNETLKEENEVDNIPDNSLEDWSENEDGSDGSRVDFRA
jgi:hypothetical protein